MDEQKVLSPAAQERADNLYALIGHFGGKYADKLRNMMSTLVYTMDFCEAPASTYYHGNYPGGLYDHSEHVFNRMRQLNMMLPEMGQYTTEDAFLVGMFHDLCKTLFYKPIKKSIKNQDTGLWEMQDAYAIEDQYPYGHGEKSVNILQMYMEVDPFDALAIRWHMGAYNVSTQRGPQEVIDVWKRFGNSCPLILFAHIADGIASHIDENNAEVFFGMEKKRIPEALLIGNYKPENVKFERVNSLPSFIEGTSERDIYISLFQMYLGRREGAGQLLNMICGQRSDFFTAPATERNQFAMEGGLCHLSLKMFSWLTALADVLNWPVSMETIAAVSLLHGLGRINTFKMETRHRKNQADEWEDYLFITRDEELPYGDMGAKSVYMVQPYQQIFGRPFLTREEALSIRWVEGALTGANISECSAAYEMYPFSFLTHAAYLLASFCQK